MGSLRTPVGPLPSSIYWRRRIIVVLLIALVMLLTLWALGSGGGGGDADPAGRDDNAGGPAESITPGPTPSESLIDERPGGREEPDDDEAGSGGGSETGTGGEGGGDGGTAGGAAGAGDNGGGGEAGGDSGGGGELPVSALPACGPDDVTLTLRSEENEYALGEEPVLRLTVANIAGVSCRVDFGYRALTVTLADSGDDQVWSSADCPDGPASAPAAVSAGSSTTHTIDWDRRHSTPGCDGSRGEPAAADTYLAEATFTGFTVVPRVSFRLDND